MSTATISPIPPVLDAQDLAKLLGVSRRQIDVLKARGELPEPIRLGARLRWRGADVAEFLERQPACGCAG